MASDGFYGLEYIDLAVLNDLLDASIGSTVHTSTRLPIPRKQKEQEVEKAEKWKQFDAIAYDLHHREKVAVRRLLQCYYYYASMQGIWFQ